MAKKKNTQNATAGYEKAGRIQARISDFKNGLRVFDSVQLVRIKSKDYSLLIMEDYFPAIGSVHGDVDLVMENDLVHISRIDGFYLHRNNQFSLLIAEDRAEEITEKEAQTE